MKESIRKSVDGAPERVLAAIGEAAELWNAAWKAEDAGGKLHLPVLAGIRRGRVLARVEVRPTDGGSEILLSEESSEYDVNRTSVLLLALGGLGGLALILWPLAPARLLGFVPPGIVFMLGAWLLVASRVRTAGPTDFLETVGELLGEDAPP